MNEKATMAIMNATYAGVNLRPEEKIRPLGELNPRPLQYQCSALPSELTSQLGAVHYVGSI